MLDREKGNFPLQDRRVAVQEYGVSNPELLAGLEQRGARVFPVCVYEWALPEDTGPLQAAVTLIIGGEIQVMLVASSVQIRHLFQIAESMVCATELHDALAQVVIASIGPLTSEELRSRGPSVDIECAHPKMGFLVQEPVENSGRLFQRKKETTTAAICHLHRWEQPGPGATTGAAIRVGISLLGEGTRRTASPSVFGAGPRPGHEAKASA